MHRFLTSACAPITLLLAAALLVSPRATAAEEASRPQHALAMFGDPALPEGFRQFRYVNPDAPQGGRLVQGLLGTFDSLNPFIVRGVPLQQIRGYVVESLMARGYDEPFTLYGLLAESVETDASRRSVTFILNPKARFSDGHPVTAEDVAFSWRLLRDKGRPNHRTYYAKVTRVLTTGDRVIRFDLDESGDRELPLILGLMPVLPKHAIDETRFESTSLAPPIGSGPYVVSEVRPGERVTMQKDPNYWGRDLAVNRGFWNFAEVRFDFYRDINAHLEAFKKGLYDVRAEHDPGRWESAYDVAAVRDGRIVKEEFPTGLPKGMAAFVFNTRRPLFADVRVREAIGELFDFEWINKNFFYGRYQRTGSYFQGSELSSLGRPADALERELLAPYPGAVRPDILEGSWAPPTSDASGRDRARLKRALALFAEAGWDLVGSHLRERRTGQTFSFEILVTSKDQERLALTFARDLRRAGLLAQVRLVDAVQFDKRRDNFEFDMLQYTWLTSLSPGNEQAFYWGSAAADQHGSRNYMGVKSAAVDATIGALLAASDRPHFVAAVRALDRLLLSGFYVVPLFHLPTQWVARWSHIAHPRETSVFGYLPETWWHQPTQ